MAQPEIDWAAFARSRRAKALRYAQRIRRPAGPLALALIAVTLPAALAVVLTLRPGGLPAAAPLLAAAPASGLPAWIGETTFALLCPWLGECPVPQAAVAEGTPVQQRPQRLSPATAPAATTSTGAPARAVAVAQQPPPAPVQQTVINNPVVERIVERIIERSVPAPPASLAGYVTVENLEAQLAALRTSVDATLYGPSPPPPAPASSGGFLGLIGAVGRIERLVDLELVDPIITGGSIAANTVSGTLTNLIDTASATITALTATNLVATNATTTTLHVSATTTTGGLRLASLDCSSLGNGGALTTDADGAVVCSADDGGGGAGFGQAWELAAGQLAPTTTLTVNLRQASSTLFSAGRAFFGETATTTIDAAGNLSVAGILGVTGATTLTNATSTAFAVTGITSSLLKTNAGGSIVPAIAGIDYASFGYHFPSNATSTSLTFSGGLTLSGGLLSALNASTTMFSNTGTAYFGGTATSTFGANGALALGGTLTLSGAPNGPLQANQGIVSATTSVGVLYGGTGLALAPGYGQLLVGNTSGGYTLTATTSLGITGSGGAGGGQLLAVYATSTPGSNVSVNFNGAAGSAPSSSAGTLTLPSNTSHIVVEVWGGGGGGAGGNSTSRLNNVAGSSGNTSCFGTNATACTSPLLQATGGAAGTTIPGAAGAGSLGDVNLTGSSGGTGDFSSAASDGGRAPRGGGGGGTTNISGCATSPGVSGNAFGGGGSGGGCYGHGGGGGGYSQKLVTSPSGTYYFTVGAGGAGGAAGSGGSAAGNGGAGGIVISNYTTGISNGSLASGTTGQVPFYNTAGTNLSATSSLFIDTTSRIGIGTTTPWATLSVHAAAGANAFAVGSSSATHLLVSSSGNVGIGVTSPSYQLQLSTDSAGKPNGGSWSNSSDQRLKDNIAPIDNGLERLLAITPVSFDWKNPHLHGGTSSAGFIAQNVEAEFPSWVNRIDCAGDDCALAGDPEDKVLSLTLPFEFDAMVVSALHQIASITGAFKDSLVAFLQAWLADAENGIARVFAHRIQTTELCIGATCLTEAQLAALLAQSASVPVPAPMAEAGSDGAGEPDTSPPTVTLVGERNVTIPVGAVYVDAGVTVIDNVDESALVNVFVDGEQVDEIVLDTSAPRTYTFRYWARDAAGNAGEAERTVAVVEAPAPDGEPETETSDAETAPPAAAAGEPPTNPQ